MKKTFSLLLVLLTLSTLTFSQEKKEEIPSIGDVLSSVLAGDNAFKTYNEIAKREKAVCVDNTKKLINESVDKNSFYQAWNLNCIVLNSSQLCSSVKSHEKHNCSEPAKKPWYVNSLGKVKACISGVKKSWQEWFKFMKQAGQYVINSETSIKDKDNKSKTVKMRDHTNAQVSKAYASMKSYMSLEMTKHQDKYNVSASKAFFAVTGSLLNKFYKTVNKLIVKAAPKIGCYNTEAKTKYTCQILAEFLAEPLLMFKFIKLGPKVMKGTKIAALFRKQGYKSLKKAKRIVENTVPKKAVLKNAKLSDTKRVKKGLKITSSDGLLKSKSIKKQKSKAIIEAHKVGGPDKGVYQYSKADLKKKRKILIDGGFTDKETNKLIRSGITGSSSKKTFGEAFKGFDLSDYETKALSSVKPVREARQLPAEELAAIKNSNYPSGVTLWHKKVELYGENHPDYNTLLMSRDIALELDTPLKKKIFLEQAGYSKEEIEFAINSKFYSPKVENLDNASILKYEELSKNDKLKTGDGFDIYLNKIDKNKHLSKKAQDDIGIVFDIARKRKSVKSKKFVLRKAGYSEKEIDLLIKSKVFEGTPYDVSIWKKVVKENAPLNDKERVSKALSMTKKNNLSETEKARLAKVVLDSHQVGGPNKGVYQYTKSELKRKRQILIDGGFDGREANQLIRSGLTGKVSVDDFIKVSNNGETKIVRPHLRKSVVNETPSQEVILRNTKLGDKKRYKEALKLTNKSHSKKLEKALIEAHEIGSNKGAYSYTKAELRLKTKILRDGGFNSVEARNILRSGLAGRPPTRTLLKEADNKFLTYNKDLLDKKYLDKRKELHTLLKEKKSDRKPSVFLPLNDILKFIRKDADNTVKNIESLYFIDNKHSGGGLININQRIDRLSKSNISEKYNKDAFKNFEETRKYLLDERPEVSIETFVTVHKKMMKGGIEDIEKVQLGRFRPENVVGNVPSSYPINKLIKKELESNPYLLWEQLGSHSDDSFYGRILYPTTLNLNPKIIDKLKDVSPDVHSALKEANLYKEFLETNADLIKAKKFEKLKIPSELKGKFSNLDELEEAARKVNDSREAITTSQIVKGLTEERFLRFQKARSSLGDIDSPEKLDEYLNIVADFQRDLVSIHPFRNGNGRSTREFGLNYLLMKEGLPPVRMVDPNSDIYRSAAQWRNDVKEGMIASDNLIDDLIEREKMGLRIGNSPELLYPGRIPATKLKVKKGTKITDTDGVEYIPSQYYGEVIKRMIKEDPSFKGALDKNPTEAWAQINTKVKEVFQKNNMHYHHAKNGLERLEINMIDEDFIELYGKSSFDNKELFDFKMKTWYKDDIVWRGLASKNAEKTEPEIINMFKNLNNHMASNSVLRKRAGSPENIKKAAVEDFKKYNNDIYDDGLIKMAKDHSETGPMYGQSYGFSTSKNRTVGKAFAMGAMVIADYGSHKTPELQALLKSRVLVGARRGYKDVDLGRLKQLRGDFSYKYGRQQEVMGIGASDPDSISVIQRIDAEGEVIETFLRNPDKPNEVWLVKGDIRPGETPTSENLIKTINLIE